jgi:hypothetical protein
VWGAVLAAAGFAASLAMPVGRGPGATGLTPHRSDRLRLVPGDRPPPNTAARLAGEQVPGVPPHAAFS